MLVTVGNVGLLVGTVGNVGLCLVGTVGTLGVLLGNVGNAVGDAPVDDALFLGL